jgi:hypothetical protein
VQHKCFEIELALAGCGVHDRDSLEVILEWDSIVSSPAMSFMLGKVFLPRMLREAKTISLEKVSSIVELAIRLRDICYVSGGAIELVKVLQTVADRVKGVSEEGVTVSAEDTKLKDRVTLGDVISEYCDNMGLSFYPKVGYTEQTRQVYDFDGELVYWIDDRLFRKEGEKYVEIAIDQLLV